MLVHDSDQTVTLGPWAGGRSKVSALVIVNERAGSVGPGARKHLLAEIATLCVRTTKTVSDLDKLSTADAAGAQLIIVLGGDGTARAVASTFISGPPIVLLPGGTRSLLSRALYGQLAWPQALRAALKKGEVAKLVGAEANGQKFFVAAMFGDATLLALAREAARLGRFDLMMSRLAEVFSRIFARPLAVRPAGGVASRAEAVGVLCPAYRGEFDDQALEWVRLNAPQVVDFVRVSVLSVIGGWRNDASIELSLSRSGEIRAVGAIAAVLDGEPATFGSRVRIRMLQDGPTVIVVK